MKTTAKALFCAFLLIMTMAVSVSALTIETAGEGKEVSYGIIEDSGSCGENATYKLYTSGYLIISGTGEMQTFLSSNHTRNLIKYVIIQDGITSISGSAFYDCFNLSSVEIPQSVTSIGGRAFMDCPFLGSITIPDGVTAINAQTFYNCQQLISITIPDSVTSIGVNAFYDCINLREIIIPDGVKTIGSGAFAGCEKLETIEIPDSVEAIGGDTGNAFKDTPWYDNQPDGVIYAGKVAYTYKGTMPKNAEIVISDDAKVIAQCAFFNRSELKSVEFSSNIKVIGDDAFGGCDSLTDIYFNGLPFQFEAIEIGAGNEILNSVTIHYSVRENDEELLPVSYDEETECHHFYIDDESEERTTGIYVIAGVTAIQYANADEYGLLASRKALLDGELTFDSARFVSEAAFKRSEGLDKHFEVTKDGTVRFYGYVYDIPESFRDDVIVIRPYLKFGDYVFYGTAMENSVSSLQP